MAEETAGQVVNNSTVADSTPAATGTPEANTPAKENLAATAQTTTEQNVPYARFKELVDEKNEFKTRFQELERKVTEGATPKEDPIEKRVKGLIEQGLDPKAAKLLVETARGISEEVSQAHLRPLQQQSAKSKTDQWIESFSRTHSDFKELEPQMNEVFIALPDSTKRMLVADDSGKGLELLYSHVKSQRMEADKSKIQDEAARAALSNRDMKKALSSTPGASAAPVEGGFTRESVGKMSTEEYRKNRDAIRKLAQEGGLK